MSENECTGFDAADLTVQATVTVASLDCFQPLEWRNRQALEAQWTRVGVDVWVAVSRGFGHHAFTIASQILKTLHSSLTSCCLPLGHPIRCRP